jgi:hypothetical protein
MAPGASPPPPLSWPPESAGRSSGRGARQSVTDRAATPHGGRVALCRGRRDKPYPLRVILLGVVLAWNHGGWACPAPFPMSHHLIP